MKLGKKVPFREPVYCVACNGSGWYDSLDKNGNSIPCSGCDGKGITQEGNKPSYRTF